jgi:hypothetical protein
MLKHPLKLIIKRKVIYSEHWKRFEPVDKIIIDNFSYIKTEADLCKYIYERHGEGRYMVLAWQKGVEGFWCFWLGFLYPNGFIRDINKNKELENLKAGLAKAKSYEEREEVEEEMNFEREIFTEIKKGTRRGPIGLIKFRPGILYPYDYNIINVENNN